MADRRRRGIVVLAVCGLAGLPTACGAEERGQRPASAAATAATTAAATPAASARVRLVPVARVDSPTAIAAPPQDRRRLYVVERRGVIRTVRAGTLLRRPFLDLSARVQAGGEQGMLGLAFAPDYATSGRFYVYYTATDGRQVLEEYRRRSGERADPGTRRRLFAHDDPEANHNGGQLVFGPDGLLYIGTGDGGGGGDPHGARGNAQNLASPLGKILRIDPRRDGGRPFTYPPTNPFFTRPGARPEIFAYGLRNPWRFSFDRRTGDLTIADVGQDAVEEVDHLPLPDARGANFGWRPFEGDRRYTDEPAPGAVAPVLVLRHDDGYCSITGGYVIRDRALGALYGRYVFGDYCKPGLRTTRLTSTGSSKPVLLPGAATISAVSTFGEDPAGRVYVASLQGRVYRLAAP